MTAGARVPLGRRLLFAERRRASLTVLGVAVALLMVLVLRGIFAGAIEQVTSYIRTSPADVFVSQAGVRTMHMSSSIVPAVAVSRLRTIPGVAWVAPISFATGSVAGPQGRLLSYLIGYDATTGRGGPTRLVAGRPPRLGEAVLDKQAADSLGVGLGDQIDVLGVRVRMVALTSGASSITNTTVFVSRRQFRLIRAGPETSYVLLGTRDGISPETVAQRVQTAIPAVTAQTRAQLAASEARIVTDMSADLLGLMSTLGLLIALAVIALGLMTATLDRVRDYAVLKALGAPTRGLAAAVAGQVLWIVAIASTVAAGLAQLVAWLLALVAPTVQLTITFGSLAQTAAGALVVGSVAALWPLVRLADVDPATAFREVR